MDCRRTLLGTVGVVLGLLGVVAVGLLVLWVLPELLTRPQGDLSAAERLKAANDVRTSSIGSWSPSALRSPLPSLCGPSC
jgi:hypothetical protein